MKSYFEKIWEIKKIRNISYIFIMFFIFITSLFFWSNYQVSKCSEKVYDNIELIPAREYGLLLGTTKISNNKYLNPYFDYRIKSAARLYHSGKIKTIIISGDNGRDSYNETRDMRDSLIKCGIKKTDMLLDYAGFRTLDSVLRAKSVFNANSYTIISQKFHCERAIFIASHHQINAIGFSAKDVPPRLSLKRFFREPLARLLAYIDVKVLNRKPHFEE